MPEGTAPQSFTLKKLTKSGRCGPAELQEGSEEIGGPRPGGRDSTVAFNVETVVGGRNSTGATGMMAATATTGESTWPWANIVTAHS